MKYADSIVLVLVGAAVLITAYGVGLLVRHARTPAAGVSPAAPSATATAVDSNDTVAAEDAGEPNERPAAAVDSNDAVTTEDAGEPNEASPVAVDSNEPAQEQTEPNVPSGDPNISSDNENGNPGLTAD